MKYIDGFRDPRAAEALRRRLCARAAAFVASGKTARIMEICGTHTMAIARSGIRGLLPQGVGLISGPGCPVCVTPAGYIDAAIALADRGVAIATFGDLVHVPGTSETLAAARSRGGRVTVCYGPSAALELAKREPGLDVVFLAVGFETTVAPAAGLVDRAAREGVRNLSLLTAFKQVPPAMAALVADPRIRIDAFLCPAHVSAVIGARAYERFAGPAGVPCVIAGFEPLDILLGLDGILAQLAAGEARVENQYRRVVRPEGNGRAREVMERYLEPSDAVWRGLGALPGSGLRLRAPYAAFDAETRHGIAIGAGRDDPRCRCGDVMKGVAAPRECPLFGSGCTPEHAVGPCMVSSEGTCAAEFKYGRVPP